LPPPPQAGGANGGKTIFNVSLDDSNAAAGKSLKNIATNLPAGAFGTAVLLSGADAPTGGAAKSNPMPVLLRLMDNGKAPNFWESGIDNCHVTGAAYGEISSERVHIRPEKIICVLLNGDIIEEKISGYVTGEDGKAGMRGRLVERQGALLAKTLFAGIASGTANSINQQYQQVSTSPLGQVATVDPNKVFESGMSSGASSALNKLADYYLERANEMYPIIEIDANRIGELVVTNGVEMGKQFIGQTRQEAVDNE
jgi:conjugal transfer pilus assembly protein TraB